MPPRPCRRVAPCEELPPPLPPWGKCPTGDGGTMSSTGPRARLSLPFAAMRAVRVLYAYCTRGNSQEFRLRMGRLILGGPIEARSTRSGEVEVAAKAHVPLLRARLPLQRKKKCRHEGRHFCAGAGDEI